MSVLAGLDFSTIAGFDMFIWDLIFHLLVGWAYGLALVALAVGAAVAVVRAVAAVARALLARHRRRVARHRKVLAR